MQLKQIAFYNPEMEMLLPKLRRKWRLRGLQLNGGKNCKLGIHAVFSSSEENEYIEISDFVCALKNRTN